MGWYCGHPVRRARRSRAEPWGAGKAGETSTLPIWAAGREDKRSALSWDTLQTVANCTINGKVMLAVFDAGSYKTILDVGMAKILGLPIREAVNGDCGTYSVPGTG